MAAGSTPQKVTAAAGLRLSPIDGTSCLIEANGFDQDLQVNGIQLDLLNCLLNGHHWQKSWASLSAEIVIDRAGRFESDSVETAPLAVHLWPDGQAILQSDRPARVRPGASEAIPDSFMPHCLGLALSQQWARAGLLPVHAAVLEIEAKGVLVLAGKGSGKSVLSLAALCNDGRVVSDDWILLGVHPSQRPWATRLRGSLSFRQSWAVEQLVRELDALEFQRWPTRPKLGLDLESPRNSSGRFPAGIPIDVVWLLERPRGGRPKSSTCEPVPSAQALAALIQSSSPLLFGASMPFERVQLMRLARRLLNASALRVRTGTDLIESPSSTLGRLIESSKPASTHSICRHPDQSQGKAKF